MPSWRGLGVDDGSASLEFITAGMLMLVPLMYAVLAVGAVQAGAFAVEGGARQAARVFVQAADDREATAAAHRAVSTALDDFGLSMEHARMTVRCSPGGCLDRRALVTVRVEALVPLPLVPSVLGGDSLAVPLVAEATQRVSRFHGED